MNVRKESEKNNEAINLNQVMESLLHNVVDAITSEQPATLKYLINIRDKLVELQNVDKNSEYNLSEDLVAKIRKAISSVDLPDDKTLKDGGIIPSSPEAIAKTENPYTSLGEQLEKSIKALNEVITVGMTVEKNPTYIPEGQERVDKLLVEVATTLLGTSLKRFNEISLPEDTSKNKVEINLNSAKFEKTTGDVSNTTIKETKTINQVTYTDPPLENKSPRTLGTIIVGGNKTYGINTVDAYIDRNSKVNQELPEVPDVSSKTDNSFNVAVKSDAKPESPTEWYRNWGWPSGNNTLNNKRISLFGNNLDLSTGYKKTIGETLSFFGLTSSDVFMMANKTRRSTNTLVNAYTIAQLMRGANSSSESKGTMSGDTKVGNIVTLDDSGSRHMLRGKVSDRGKLAVTDNAATRTTDGGFQNDNTVISAKKDYDAPGTDTSYISHFISRTELITSNKRGTGFLKIYLRRGPKFIQVPSIIKIIPFQFEPKVTGDSKAAEYSAISTLAKSQSAQVYRKSTERAISIELNYLITGKDEDETRFVNESTSKSALDLGVWTEDYVYNYIVRNLRNLVLPNISDPGYQLAPPIIQVWYGGLVKKGSSTGSLEETDQDAIVDETNIQLGDIHPTFRTNWYSYDSEAGAFKQKSYRSLWVCTNVGFEYAGGIINRYSRRNLQVNVTLALTEIAPSVTDNEILIWSPEPSSPAIRGRTQQQV
jgi:hypothetical protein